MNDQEKKEVLELNERVKITIKPSSIHGVGVFALRKIFIREKLYLNAYPKPYRLFYENFDALRPEVKNQILTHWPIIANGSPFAWPDTCFLAWMNHSDNPNCDPINDIALRDIEEGEEITEDYRSIRGAEKIFDFI